MSTRVKCKRRPFSPRRENGVTVLPGSLPVSPGGKKQTIRTRTRKRHIRNQRPAEMGLPITDGFTYRRGEIVSDFTAGRRSILIVLVYCITLCNVTVTRNSCCNSWIRKGNSNVISKTVHQFVFPCEENPK